MEQFPDIDALDGQSAFSASPSIGGYHGRQPSADRWLPRKDSGFRASSWGAQASTGGRGHGRQKSLGDALKTIRTRRGSVSANVHEISDALKAPVSPKLIVRNSFIAAGFMLIDRRYSV
jgi:solute carrier family 35 protein E1